MVSKELLAFQTVDSEGDIWNNTALVFATEEDVNNFFSNPELVVYTLGYEVEEGEDVNTCMEVRTYEGRVFEVNINLEYCGKVTIREMSVGFVIGNL